jgi:tight adherence protein B
MDMTMILIIGGAAILVMLVVGLVISSQEERHLVDDRLERYLRANPGTSASAAKSERSAQVSEWISDQATQFSWGQGLARDLARADIKLRVGEYIAIVIAVVLGMAFLAWLLGGRQILSALIGSGIGFVLPRIYVNREQGNRLRRFDTQLGDMLNLMVNGLRTGYSTMQAMEAVSRELPSPISDEFRRVVQEMQLGISMERALDNLTRRIPSQDLELVVTAINVQREVGGSLSEILNTISHTIRERVRIKGEIRVLTATVMTSGKALALMPVGLGITLYFMNREYVERFWNPDTRLVGIPALIIAAILVVIGYQVMKKIADIQV